MYRKKAIREMERSSLGDREETKIERRKAGVTMMRLFESVGGCWKSLYLSLGLDDDIVDGHVLDNQ